MAEIFTIDKQDNPLVLDVAQVIALEQAIDKAGTPLAELMDRAGRSVAQLIIDRCSPDKRVIIFCGTGNNGGDGWVCAHELAQNGWTVSLVTPCPAQEIKAEPARSAALKVMESIARSNQNLSIVVLQDCENPEAVARTLPMTGAEVIVDAMLGTGFSSETLRAPYKEWTETINAEKQKRNDLLVVAVDVPSGLSAQTGEAAIPCIEADITITMIVYKPGLLTGPGKDLCGEILVSKIAEIEQYLNQL